MGAPAPIQGHQTQHTERPVKMYAEQYLLTAPLPIGAVLIPEIFPDGKPRVMTATTMYVLNETDWVLSSRYSGQAVEVISAEEFAERFGPSSEL